MAIGTWFRTEHDVPAHVLDLPVEITSGKDPGICILDQVVRGTGIVGRVTGDFGAVALKVRGTGRPMHVSVTVHLDEVATRWWSDRVKPPRNVPELPRLVVLRSQGLIRGAALLARRQGWRRAGGSKITIEYDLTAEELDADGLLLIELAEPPRPPWVEGRLTPRSALGVRIDRICVQPAADPDSSGDSAANSGCDLAVFQPGVTGDFRVDALSVPPAPPLPRSPSNRWTRRKPARAGFKAVRLAQRVATRATAKALPARAGNGLDLLAVDLVTGEPAAVEVLKRRPGGLDVRLPEPAAGPVLIGLSQPERGLSLRVRPGAAR